MELLRVLDTWFLHFGTVDGNRVKNAFIWISGGIVLSTIIAILMARLFLLYRKSLDMINQRFIKDVIEGIKKPNAVKKPMTLYKPDKITVLRWGKTERDRSYLTDPKTIPEVIDAGLAVILLVFLSKKTMIYKYLPRIKFIFYSLLVISFIVAIIGFWLSLNILPGK